MEVHMGGKACTTEIRHRGQITIPKVIRQESSMEEGQQVSIIPLGDSILITPKRLDLDEARREIRRVIKATGVSAEEVLAGLGAERETLFGELYGPDTPKG
jgi:AbrB family looped-hinge helix DNA binding protein